MRPGIMAVFSVVLNVNTNIVFCCPSVGRALLNVLLLV